MMLKIEYNDVKVSTLIADGKFLLVQRTSYVSQPVSAVQYIHYICHRITAMSFGNDRVCAHHV